MEIFISYGPCILVLIGFCVCVACLRHVSRPMVHTLYGLNLFFVIKLIISSNLPMLKLILSWFILLLFSAIYIFLSFKIKYDFMRKILSFTMIFHNILPISRKNGDRIIGRVIPYSNSQLKYNGKMIVANEIATAGSTLISGSTGSGKTYGMMSLIKQNIADGRSVIFSEYKGDPSVVQELISYAEKYNYEIFNLSDGVSNFNYDPLANLNNVGRVEAVMNMRKWSMDGSDAHYKTGTQLLLQKMVGEFSKIYQDMKYSRGKSVSFTYEFFEFVKRYQPALNDRDSYFTIQKLLELLITSSLSPMFKFENGKTFSFEEYKNKKFLFISSFVSSNKELATSFSSLLFRDLLDECTIEPPLYNIYLYIDEFATLDNPFIIKDVLEKGRSGRIAPTLALQDINQIVIQTNEAYLNSILGTINSYIIYAGATRTTAEKFAGVQLMEIESIIMNLRKPINGKKPTAIYISKYPTLNKRITSEVFRFEPYIFDKGAGKPRKSDNVNHRFDKNDYDVEKEIQAIDAMVEANMSINTSSHASYQEDVDVDFAGSEYEAAHKTEKAEKANKTIKLNLKVGDEESGRTANYDDLI